MICRHLLLLLVAFFASFTLSASTIQVSGNIASNTTWSADTVKVVGNLTLNTNIVLTINPGTVVMFMGFYNIASTGHIHAVGTATDSIRFTYHDTTGLSNNSIPTGGWIGINSQNITPSSTDSTRFIYCVIEYAKEAGANSTGALQFRNFSNAVISHCTFRYNKFKTFYGAIFVSDSTSMIITHNEFHHNTAGSGAGIACFYSSNPLIFGNSFHHNWSNLTGGAIHCQYASCPRIVNNFMCNNSTKVGNCGPGEGGGAIRCLYQSHAYIANNVIANNTTGVFGGGIDCKYGAYPTIENNTIVNNYAAGGLGGGILIQEAGAYLRNNIIWGNTTIGGGNQVTWMSADSTLQMGGALDNNCVVNSSSELYFTQLVNYTGTIQNNITTPPQFINPSAGAGIGFDGLNADWRLQTTSNCINLGTGGVNSLLPSIDLWGNPRHSGWQYDIGAFEDPTVSSVPGIDDATFAIYPNPANRFIILEPTTTEQYTATLYDLSGRIILTVNANGNSVLQIPEKVATGIYMLRIVSNDAMIEKKVVIEK
jgi:hypothetical protein